MKRILKTTAALSALMLTALLSPAGAQLAGPFGILDVEANGGINPNTGVAWVDGDQFRLAFHTLGTITATSNDPSVYDNFATTEAQQNPALASSTGWTAMLWVNTDGSVAQGVSPVSSPLDRSGSSDFTDGANQGGAGVPVYAMDGTTAIARNNNDIYNGWSNPFESGLGVTQADGSGNNTQRVSGVFYSPFLNQNGDQLTTPDANHGRDNWTAGFGSLVNAAGDTIDEVRTSLGSSNANNSGRVWNRFNRDNTSTLGVYALSELLTVTTGGDRPSFTITEYVVDEDTGTVELTWNSKEGKSYIVRYSLDLVTWPGDVDDGVGHDADGNGDEFTTITLTIAESALNGQARWFLRVEELD